MRELDNLLFVEKYRPRTIDQCILPAATKQQFQQFVESGDMPNLTLIGPAGVGKTTIARALCDQLDFSYLMINGSEDGNIDTLRGKIRDFASTMSINGKRKAVIFDEADYLNAQSTQPALRGFIEEFADCRFILTGNYGNRILKELKSRTSVVHFNLHSDDVPGLMAAMFNRCGEILEKENITYTEDDLFELISRYAPDWRRVLNEMQRHSSSGTLVMIAGQQTDNIAYKELVQMLKGKNFNAMRKWVVDNGDVDHKLFIRGIYNHVTPHVVDTSVPQLILILADYQYKAAFVADLEINIVACLTEIMAQVSFK